MGALLERWSRVEWPVSLSARCSEGEVPILQLVGPGGIRRAPCRIVLRFAKPTPGASSNLEPPKRPRRGSPTQPPHPPIPWAAVAKPLSESKVALLITAGISMKGDSPFDMESERRHPTWGDPTFRRILSHATAADVEVNHLHINTVFIRRDLNVALPLDRLRELVREGVVGVGGRHALLDHGLSGIEHQGARERDRAGDRRRDGQGVGRPRRCSPRCDPTAAGPWDWSRG